MKTVKLLLCFLAFSTAFYSCSDSNAIENQTTTQKSIALRTALNELKMANNITGRSATNPFCFEFVFPLSFTYSNGTTVTAASFQGLLEILINESPDLYIEGIAFPFNVAYGGMIHTISTEAEFTALMVSCEYPTFNQDLQTTFCFDLIFPIQITGVNGEVVTVHTMAELSAYLNDPTNGTEAQVVFPISVSYNNQTVVIHNVYEFYDMVNNCDSCICTQEYAPVCVNTATGTMEFGNMCYALCAGYTQNDLVSCNPTTQCNIENLTVTPGECNADYSYQLTIDFTYTNPGTSQFIVYNSANAVVGTYNLADLPVTIDHYVSNTNATDHLSVNIVGGTCDLSQQWTLPNCGCSCSNVIDPVCVQTATSTLQFDNACLAECAGYTVYTNGPCTTSTSNFGTLLGTCFTMQYPLQVMYQGALVTVNSDSELLQYWFPAVNPLPPFHYPVTLIFANATTTAGSQADVEYLINANCN